MNEEEAEDVELATAYLITQPGKDIIVPMNANFHK